MTDQCATRIHNPEGNVHFLAWNYNGRLLAACCGDGVIRIWDIYSGKWLRTIRPELPISLYERYQYVSLVWHPNKNILAASVFHITNVLIRIITDEILIWNFEEDINALPERITHPIRRRKFKNLSWCPNGRYLAVNIGKVSVYDTLLKSWDDFINTSWILSMDWSPKGDRIAIQKHLYYDCQLQIWDVQTRTPQLIIEIEYYIYTKHCFSWSPDATMITTVENTEYTMYRGIYLWFPMPNKAPKAIRGFSEDIYMTAWSPDSKTVASISKYCYADYEPTLLGDVASGKNIKAIYPDRKSKNGTKGSYSALAWNPCCDKLALGNLIGTINIIHTKGPTILKTLVLDAGSHRTLPEELLNIVHGFL